MAAEQAENAAVAAAAAKGGGTLKAMIVLFAVLALEGGTIAVTMMLAGGPSEVQGVGLENDAQADANKLVEVLVIKDKFENLKTGRQFIYDTEVYITVKKRDEADVKEELERQKAQISMAIATIIRQAEPAFFQEATYATLRRQMKAELAERLGEDTEGESVVQDVLITRCIPFRGDF